MDSNKAIEILKQLIKIPSFSREEKLAADYLQSEISAFGYRVERHGNNLIVKSKRWDDKKPVLLLNSHIDTVKPGNKWTIDPFIPALENGVLYGLGSNDAGGCLVSLLATFINLDTKEQCYNLVFAASAEEEVSGFDGIARLVPLLPPVDFAIVGEPTQMNMAIAEKGLMVLDCSAAGSSGHAARNEGVNAIYQALIDLDWFRTYTFERVSDLLGSVKMTVTQIQAGSQHNVVPDICDFVVDVRSNECYSNEELFKIIQKHVNCKVVARSLRLNSSATPADHPLIKRGLEMGRNTYGSPTTSDQALMPWASVKMGPGDSARSHTADEFIMCDEIKEGIDLYIKLLDGLKIC